MCKAFDGMTDEAIVELTDSAIEAMIDYECAKQGVPLLKEPAPEAPKLIPPDAQIFTLSELKFLNRSDAEKVRSFAETLSLTATGYDWTTGYNVYYLQAAEPLAISESRVFSADAYNQRRQELAEREARDKTYKKAKAKYDETATRREEIANPFTERISNARSAVAYKAQLQREFERYLELAKGDAEIARNFLAKVYTIPENWEPQIGQCETVCASEGAALAEVGR